jgi:multiple sugar transport system substrate-binding protein
MYYSEFWNNRVVDGDRIIALPFGIGANIVLYNKDVFDDAGVDYPNADWTAEDFISVAKSVADPSKGIWGGDRPRGAFRAVFNNYGAFPYSDDSTTVEGYFNSDASLAAFTWFWDLVDSGVTPTPAEIDVLGTEGTGPVDLFIAGRLALATLNQTHLLTALKSDVNFGVVPEPKGPSDVRHVNAWSARPGIWKGSEHPDEAWELIKFWAGADGQRYMMENGLNMFPAMPEVIVDHPFADHEGVKAFFPVLEWPQVAGWQSKHLCWRAAVRRVGETWDLLKLGELGRDEIKASLDKDIPILQTTLDDCVARLGS